MFAPTRIACGAVVFATAIPNHMDVIPHKSNTTPISHLLLPEGMPQSYDGRMAQPAMVEDDGPDIRSFLAAEVRAEAARRRILQRELAVLLGINQPAVSGRLTGRTPFTVEELIRLSLRFGMSAGELVERAANHAIAAASQVTEDTTKASAGPDTGL